MTSRLRPVIGGAVGNLVEWYDWFAYSSFALYFAEVFFPKGDRTAQLLNTAAIFAVGYLVRPLGSWLTGIYADRVGRRAALAVSMLVMGIGSLAIGLTPGYAQIGIWAPILLTLARILQGLSIGGEYAASATYLSEVAGRRHRGFLASFQYVTLILGQLLALVALIVLQATLSPEALTAWGWRIPFFIGALCAVTALWIRVGLPETASFEAARERHARTRTWQLMAQHPKELAIVFGITAAGAVSFYTFSAYMQKFLVNTSGFTKDAATQISALSLVVFMLLQPALGWLSDRVGRRPLLIAFGALGTILTVPLMTTLSTTHDFALALVLVIVSLAILTPYTAISGLYKAELFPTEIRALAVGLPYSLGGLAGGSAEVVALSFKQAGHESWFYWYVTAFMAAAFLIAVFMRDTQIHSRILED